MKREILFRGKRLDNGEWVYGYYCKTAFRSTIIPSMGIDRNGIRHIEVDPDTVGQFSGMIDKMGKRIFEDDIVRATDYDVFAEAFVVRYGRCGGVQNVDHEVGYVGFYVEPVGIGAAELLEFGIRTDILYWMNEYEMEVVGNAFENPELLEVKSR